MMQFVPENGVYVYFRYDKNQTVMCIMNPENATKKVPGSRFAEMMSGKSKGIEVTNGTRYELNEISVPAKTLLVLDLK
jgi:neopullulanase